MASLGQAVAELILDATRFNRGIASAEGSLRSFSAETVAITRGMAEISKIGAIAGGAIVAGLGKAVKDFAAFEETLINVKAVSSDTTVTLEALQKEIFALSFDTAKGPKELADALYDIVQAGFDLNKTIDTNKDNIADMSEGMFLLKQASITASAGLTDVGTAARVISSVLLAYNLDVREATKVSDILFQTVLTGNVKFEELARSMGLVLPSAKAIGIQLEELGAAYSSLTLQGLTARQSTQQLNGLFNSLLNPSHALTVIYGQMGVASGQAAIAQFGLIGTLNQIKEAVGGNETALKKALGVQTAFRANLFLTANGAILYTDALTQMRKATADGGVTQNVFKQQVASTAFQLRQAKVSINQASIALGKGFAPIVREMANVVAILASGVAKLPPRFLEIITAVAGGLGALLLTTSAYLRIASSVKIAREALSKMSAAFATENIAARAATSSTIAQAAAEEVAATARIVSIGSAVALSRAQLQSVAANAIDIRTRQAASNALFTYNAALARGIPETEAMVLATTQLAEANILLIVSTEGAALAQEQLAVAEVIAAIPLGRFAKLKGLFTGIGTGAGVAAKAVKLLFVNLLKFTAIGAILAGIAAIGDGIVKMVEGPGSGTPFALDWLRKGLEEGGKLVDKAGFDWGERLSKSMQHQKLLDETAQMARDLGLAFDEGFFKTHVDSFGESLTLDKLGISTEDLIREADQAGKDIVLVLLEHIEEFNKTPGLRIEDQINTPQLADLRKRIEATTGMTATTEQMAQALNESEEEAAANAAEFQRLTEKITKTEAAFRSARAGGLSLPLTQTAAEFENFSESLSEAIGTALAGLGDVGNDLSGPLEFLNSQLHLGEESAAGMTIALNDMATGIDFGPMARNALQLSEALFNADAQIANVNEKIDAHNQKISEWEGILSLVEDTVGTATSEFDDLNAQLAEGEITQDQYNKKIKEAVPAYAELNELVAEGLLSEEQAAQVKQASIELSERAAKGVLEERAANALLLIEQNEAIKNRDKVVEAIGKADAKTQQFVGSLTSESAQMALNTVNMLAYLASIGQIPPSKVSQVILDMSRADPEIAALFKTLGLLEGEHTMTFKAETDQAQIVLQRLNTQREVFEAKALELQIQYNIDQDPAILQQLQSVENAIAEIDNAQAAVEIAIETGDFTKVMEISHGLVKDFDGSVGTITLRADDNATIVIRGATDSLNVYIDILQEFPTFDNVVDAGNIANDLVVKAIQLRRELATLDVNDDDEANQQKIRALNAEIEKTERALVNLTSVQLPNLAVKAILEDQQARDGIQSLEEAIIIAKKKISEIEALPIDEQDQKQLAIYQTALQQLNEMRIHPEMRLQDKDQFERDLDDIAKVLGTTFDAEYNAKLGVKPENLRDVLGIVEGTLDIIADPVTKTLYMKLEGDKEVPDRVSEIEHLLDQTADQTFTLAINASADNVVVQTEMAKDLIKALTGGAYRINIDANTTEALAAVFAMNDELSPELLTKELLIQLDSPENGGNDNGFIEAEELLIITKANFAKNPLIVSTSADTSGVDDAAQKVDEFHKRYPGGLQFTVDIQGTTQTVTSMESLIKLSGDLKQSIDDMSHITNPTSEQQEQLNKLKDVYQQTTDIINNLNATEASAKVSVAPMTVETEERLRKLLASKDKVEDDIAHLQITTDGSEESQRKMDALLEKQDTINNKLVKIRVGFDTEEARKLAEVNFRDLVKPVEVPAQITGLDTIEKELDAKVKELEAQSNVAFTTSLTVEDTPEVRDFILDIENLRINVKAIPVTVDATQATEKIALINELFSDLINKGTNLRVELEESNPAVAEKLSVLMANMERWPGQLKTDIETGNFDAFNSDFNNMVAATQQVYDILVQVDPQGQATIDKSKEDIEQIKAIQDIVLDIKSNPENFQADMDKLQAIKATLIGRLGSLSMKGTTEAASEMAQILELIKLIDGITMGIQMVDEHDSVISTIENLTQVKGVAASLDGTKTKMLIEADSKDALLKFFEANNLDLEDKHFVIRVDGKEVSGLRLLINQVAGDLHETMDAQYTAFLDANADGVIDETDLAIKHLTDIAKRWTAYLELIADQPEKQIEFIQQRLTDIGQSGGIDVKTNFDLIKAMVKGLNQNIDDELINNAFILTLDANADGVVDATEFATVVAGQWDEKEFTAEIKLHEEERIKERLDDLNKKVEILVINGGKTVEVTATLKSKEDISPLAQKFLEENAPELKGKDVTFKFTVDNTDYEAKIERIKQDDGTVIDRVVLFNPKTEKYDTVVAEIKRDAIEGTVHTISMPVLTDAPQVVSTVTQLINGVPTKVTTILDAEGNAVQVIEKTAAEAAGLDTTTATITINVDGNAQEVVAVTKEDLNTLPKKTDTSLNLVTGISGILSALFALASGLGLKDFAEAIASLPDKKDVNLTVTISSVGGAPGALLTTLEGIQKITGESLSKTVTLTLPVLETRGALRTMYNTLSDLNTTIPAVTTKTVAINLSPGVVVAVQNVVKAIASIPNIDFSPLNVLTTTLITISSSLMNVTDTMSVELGEINARLDDFGSLLSEKATLITEAFKTSFDNGIKGLGSTIVDDINSVFDNFGIILENMSTWGKLIGGSFTAGIVNGMNIPEVYARAYAMAKAAYEGTLIALRSGSPSKLMMEVGGWFTEGFAIGIEAESNTAETNATRMAEDTSAALKSSLESQRAIIATSGRQLVSGANSYVEAAVSAMRSGQQTLAQTGAVGGRQAIDFILQNGLPFQSLRPNRQLVDGWINIGEGMWQSVITGFTKQGFQVEDGTFVNPGFFESEGYYGGVTMAEALQRGFQEELLIGSPSRVFIAFGNDIKSGLEDGLLGANPGKLYGQTIIDSMITAITNDQDKVKNAVITVMNTVKAEAEARAIDANKLIQAKQLAGIDSALLASAQRFTNLSTTKPLGLINNPGLIKAAQVINQNATISPVFHIYDAQDPDAVADKVYRQLYEAGRAHKLAHAGDVQ